MAIFVNKGRSLVAQIMSQQTLHMAWGRGLTSWDANTPSESLSAVSLTDEFGRRKVTQTNFVTPDEQNGAILVPQGRFSISPTPTKYLYVLFSFDFLDAPTEIIREVGVFVGTTVKAGVPASKAYLLPSEIENAGTLLTLEHIPRIDRSNTVRQQFEFVIQF